MCKEILKVGLVNRLFFTLVALSCLSLSCPSLHGQTSTQVGAAQDSATANRSVEIESKKLELEREKFELEKKKAWISAGAIAIPLLIGVLGILGVLAQIRSGFRLKESETRTAFELKAAEIVLSSGGPKKAKARATVLSQLFPNRLPENFSESFNPSIMPGSQHADKLEFLKLAMEKPDKRAELIALWKELFPWDGEWIPKA